MKVRFYFLILFLTFLFSSCHTVVKILYGVKNPRYETEESLIAFQNDVGFGPIPFVGAKSELWKNGKLFDCPDVIVFDNKGRYIPYRDSLNINCNGPAELFLAGLNTGTAYNFSDLYSLDTFNDLVESPFCNAVENFYKEQIDFYVFITYAVFTGKRLIKEKSLIWSEAIKNNNGIKYKLIYINLDLKECWSDEQKRIFDSQK